MEQTRPIAYESVIANVMTSMAEVHEALNEHELDAKLRHLVRLRASQINNCAFCVKMHIREAREDGETSERLDRVVVWNHVSDFTPGEKAALAWTEALTEFDRQIDLGPLRADLRAHFSETEIGVLTGEIAMINLWNRIGVSRH